MNANKGAKEEKKVNSNTKSFIFEFMKDKFLSAELSIWLTLSTTIGYGIYYVYTWFYLSYYGLGREFIDFSLQGVANIACLTLLIFFFISLILSLSTEPIFFTHKQFVKKVMRFLYIPIFVVLLMVLLLTLLSNGIEALNTTATIMSFFLIPLAFWLVRNEPKKIRTSTMVLVAFGYVIGASSTFGQYMAQQRESYYIIKHGKDHHYAVISNYDKQLIIAPVDLDKKVITPRYSLVEPKSNLNKLVGLEVMKFDGGLKVEQVKVK
ncbi:hypothetical protein NQ109_28430 [Priestia megaterium]|uniref:hypothetical protein n=1 Tax=Priestia megaterium TaxID=1404 RepID=UPI00215AD62C|nr:hypothetical protein [Priestia megaterium]MCR8866856.1 hypothetical protein [Priestia megaterium]MDN4865894.1 hypothetical protein [Priestia megaterium]